MNSHVNPPDLWQGQRLHFGSLAILITLMGIAWAWLGKPHAFAFWACAVIPVTHQIFVWLAWRVELRSSHTSKAIGFQLYLVIFFTLFLGRFVSVFWLAYLDRESLGLADFSRVLVFSITFIPGVYALHSVKRYFGLARAAGADHFDASYRAKPFVKEGIFRYTDNAMYWYAFLLFWAIAVGFNSAAAVIAVVFSHVYIWVLFYSTEKPDIDFIYGLRQ